MFGQRILFLAPHPDDEIVAACASMERARAEGARIFVLYLTHGCPPEATLWPWNRKSYASRLSRRREEAEKAASFLNFEIAGFAERPARTLWLELDAALKEIRDAVKKNEIDQLWVPAYEGGHPDHDGINGLCSLLRKGISVIEFAEYNYCGRRKNAQSFPAPNGKEETVRLTAKEITRKTEALELYASEKGNLDYVGLAQESFRPLAPYDYAKPPHEGALWYTRFQWVPFRHPRVDFTNPKAVCEALSRLERTSALPESARRQAPEHTG